MRKKIAFLTMLLNCLFIAYVSAAEFSNETLHYVISYKWGLIHKDAGEATLSLKNKGSDYSLTLVGRTKPWADSFYQVRDTLLGTVRKNGFRPLTYSKIAHEKGRYSRDDISFIYSGNVVGGEVKRLRQGKDGKITTSEKKLTGSGKVFDMLSVFYFLRTIDYSRLSEGQVVKATVFSGSKAETLTIRSVGKETVKLRDKSKREAYHIKFKFTTAGKSKSSDDIDTWISTDPSHIPLMVVGSLPVGQVKCYYIP
ncbi:MAG: DUF3108 domain-containing protein [Muribaculaceae bacterium]|nr:DUF3108 domain-containing protein [Muribaculaceae bacterium]